jgi:hypothetical protein
MSTIRALSLGQLAAYNRLDLDEFCSFYHQHVSVLDETGAIVTQGIEAFRARYGTMFATHDDVRAEVDLRMELGAHSVEREYWSRVVRATGESLGGTLLVRYTESDGRIRWVEFLRP